jgi:hypothetical protein
MKRLFSGVLMFLLAAQSLAAAQQDHQPWIKNQLGEQVTLEGRAENRKDGAVLVMDYQMIWIDGLPGWPVGYDEYLYGGEKVKNPKRKARKHARLPKNNL